MSATALTAPLPRAGSGAATIGGSDGLLARLQPYRRPIPGRARLELAVTALPFALLWLGMWHSLAIGYWLTLLLAVPAAGFLVRLFVIQHDCGHGSFFRSRHANDWLGRAIGVLTLTPYAHWRLQHALHHGTSGNLDRRGDGDVEMLTVAEYEARPWWRRGLYRLFRHPATILGLGPLFVFVLRQRLPENPRAATARAWRDVMASNLAIAAALATLGWLVGPLELVLVQLPVTWLASAGGIWLFYVQHQFEHTYWERDPAWKLHAGGLIGSSHLDLPPVLRWFTANIGLHHVHHLSATIPSYRLGEVLRDLPELRDANRLTLRQSFHCFRLALWDENAKRLVSFRDARA